MSWLSSLAHSPSEGLFLLLLFFLPSQLGKHFWPPFSFINGLRVDYLSPTLYFTDIIVMLLFILMLPTLLRSVRLRSMIVIGVVLLYLTAVSFHSQWPTSSLLGVVRIAEVVFVGWLVTQFINNKRLYIASLVALSASLFTITALSVWQFIVQHSVGGLWYWLGERSFSITTPGIANATISGNLVLRPYATFSHPNVLGGFCVITVCYLLYFSGRVSDKVVSYVIAAAIFCGIAATILSMSRTAIVVLGIILVVWAFQQMYKNYKYHLLIVAVGIGAIGLLLLSGSWDRFSSLSMADEGVVVREYLSAQALHMVSNNLIVGVGIQNFLPSLALQIDPLLPYRNLQPVHSLYLLILAETGIVGAVIFIGGVGYLLYKIRQSSSLRVGKFMLLLSILLLGLTDHYLYTLHQGQLLLGFAAGVILTQFPVVLFTDLKAKNLGMQSERTDVKKAMSSGSLKISRIRISSRKKTRLKP